MKTRILVTGAHGLLGSEIVPVFANEFDVVPIDLAHCDITVAPEVEKVFRDVRPAIAIHCAAYTAVDRAEHEREKAFLVNEHGTRNVADACARADCLLVTYSTDYVFDGLAGRAYREDDATRPLSAYGESKLAAEKACVESGANFLAIRTQWLYGAHGKNFIFAILDRAGKGEPLRVVNDQTGCPTWARDLAGATRHLIDAGARGIVHFSNAGQTTWFDFARLIVGEGIPGPVEISSVTTASLSLAASRPTFSPLDKGHYHALTGRTPRPWDVAAREFIRGCRSNKS
ncbi:MAG TPA: dTDP-4-dehydrorhamnose reductase [Candidatus Deferrimicrobiaceae bacterium]|jgi:dTDP-4-dehydrorhamnose reductase